MPYITKPVNYLGDVFLNDVKYYALLHRYQSKGGGYAITLIDGIDGSPAATCTACLSSKPPYIDPGQVAIKDYSEYEGILDALIAANIIDPPEYSEYSGFIELPICRIRPQLLDLVLNAIQNEGK